MKFSKSFSFVILGMALATLASCSGSGRKFYKLIEEVPATCTRGGMLAHYESQPDGDKETIYLDVDKKQVQLEDLIIPALGHTMTYVPEQFATCDQEGVIAHYHCATCNLDYEDEAGKVLADDLHTSTKGHVMDQEWTQSETEDKHYHKCAREGCTHIEDETDCVFDREVVKEDAKVDGKENSYYCSCVCGRVGATKTFEYVAPETYAADDSNWGEGYRTKVGLDEYDPDEDKTVTLSNLGLSKDYTPITANHLFGTYNAFDEEKGIDLKFTYKFDAVSEAYSYVYLPNGGDESGLIIRFMSSRDDGYVEGYYYTNGTEEGGKLLSGGVVGVDGKPYLPNAPKYFVTRPGEKENNEHDIHIQMVPHSIDNPELESNYKFYKVTVDVDGKKFEQSEGSGEITDVIFGLPNEYFTEKVRNKVRFSIHKPECNGQIKDANLGNKLVVYDDLGNCIGAKTYDNTGQTFALTDLTRTGNKFVGWFDTTGARFTSYTPIMGKTEVYPHFIEVGDAMSHTAVTLSDLGLLEQGSKPYTTNNEIAGDFEEGFRRIPVSGKTTSVSISFIAEFEFAKDRGGKVVDDYFQFGLPYDYKDNQTRFIFRINADSRVNSLRGYVGGPATSLGEHGTEGTFFSDDNFVMTEGASYLITMSYEEEPSSNGTGLTYTFEIVDLGRQYSRSFSYVGIEFINSDDFSFNNPYRNYFSVIRSRADAVLTMKNAW